MGQDNESSEKGGELLPGQEKEETREILGRYQGCGDVGIMREQGRQNEVIAAGAVALV